MSFLFGSAKGHHDPELAAANRRQREHIARDINDQRTLNAGADIAGYRRRTPWLLLAAVATFFLLAAVFRGGAAESLLIERSCTQPGLVLEASVVTGGDPLRIRSTGPQEDLYVLTIKGEPVQGQPDTATTFTSTPDGPAYSLTDCVSPSFLIQSPVQAGEYDVALLQLGPSGAEEVASLALTVTD